MLYEIWHKDQIRTNSTEVKLVDWVGGEEMKNFICDIIAALV